MGNEAIILEDNKPINFANSFMLPHIDNLHADVGKTLFVVRGSFQKVLMPLGDVAVTGNCDKERVKRNLVSAEITLGETFLHRGAALSVLGV